MNHRNMLYPWKYKNYKNFNGAMQKKKKEPWFNEYKNVAKMIDFKDIVSAMFDREIWIYYFADEFQIQYLSNDNKAMIMEFFENDYMRLEGNCLMWKTWPRTEKCELFRKNGYEEYAAQLLKMTFPENVIDEARIKMYWINGNKYTNALKELENATKKNTKY